MGERVEVRENEDEGESVGGVGVGVAMAMAIAMAMETKLRWRCFEYADAVVSRQVVISSKFAGCRWQLAVGSWQFVVSVSEVVTQVLGQW